MNDECFYYMAFYFLFCVYRNIGDFVYGRLMLWKNLNLAKPVLSCQNYRKVSNLAQATVDTGFIALSATFTASHPATFLELLKNGIGGKKMADEKRLNFPMRHENGNCLPCGGFCTAVNDQICESLHNAFRHGESAECERFTLASIKESRKFQEEQLEALRAIYKKVTSTPANVVEVVRGRWLHNEDYEDWAERYVCSVCNSNALTDGDYRSKLSNYCPNCGAKMDGRLWTTQAK